MAEFTVTPWEVKGIVDYKKLIEEFGTKEIDDRLKKRIAKLFGEEHMFLRRGIYYSHRDLDLVLDDFERGKDIFLYTGRGPSGKLHLGHMMQFLFSKWLQEKLGANLYIEITDDEKFMFKKDASLAQIEKRAAEDILDIAAVGFDEEKTFIFKDTEYIRNMYKMATAIAKRINLSTARAVFGFENTSNVGMAFFPALEIVPTMFEKGRCLIPAAIDQDPYWRLQRDIAGSFGYPKSSQVHSKLLPALAGLGGKMSSSIPETAVYLDDAPETVRKKIMNAFSGGQESIEMHRKLGGNPDADVAFQWLYFMFEPDDTKIKKIEEEYRSGSMLSGELKELLVSKVVDFFEEHREKREEAEDVVDTLMHTGKLAVEMWKKEF